MLVAYRVGLQTRRVKVGPMPKCREVSESDTTSRRDAAKHRRDAPEIQHVCVADMRRCAEPRSMRDGKLRLSTPGGLFVGIDGKCKDWWQRVRCGDIDQIIGFGEMKIVGTCEELA
jgi:hypothetical protein